MKTRYSFPHICTLFVLFMSFSLLLSACGKGKTEQTAEDLLTTVDWININDGDVYSFYVDGTGKHGKVSISYSYNSQTKVMEITEGVGNTVPICFTLNTEKDYPRLMPDDKSTFYVSAPDYDEISATVRSENMDILTTVGTWETKSSWSGNKNGGVGTATITFNENGNGRIVISYGSKIYADTELAWKMLDNDTLECLFDTFGQTWDMNLDISNVNGEYKLLIHDDPSIYYLPVI